jgi:Fe-S cluster assembly protein SufB
MSDKKKRPEDELLKEVTSTEYKYGFTTDIESDTIPKGLSEEVVRIISAKKNEPKWMLDYRLKSYKAWLEMDEPDWPNITYKKPDYQEVIYYSAPKQRPVLDSLDDLDPEMKKTFDKLGISLEEQKKLANVAVDIVMDSVSVATSFKEKLAELGIIFCPISDAIQEHPELVKKYLGTVVPLRDNFFAALNSAVF